MILLVILVPFMAQGFLSFYRRILYDEKTNDNRRTIQQDKHYPERKEQITRHFRLWAGNKQSSPNQNLSI